MDERHVPEDELSAPRTNMYLSHTATEPNEIFNVTVTPLQPGKASSPPKQAKLTTMTKVTSSSHTIAARKNIIATEASEIDYYDESHIIIY